MRATWPVLLVLALACAGPQQESKPQEPAEPSSAAPQSTEPQAGTAQSPSSSAQPGTAPQSQGAQQGTAPQSTSAQPEGAQPGTATAGASSGQSGNAPQSAAQAQPGAAQSAVPAPGAEAFSEGPNTFRPLTEPAPMQTVVLANAQDPIVSIRLVFHAGSVDDPKGKEGLTSLTARLMSEGGTQSLTSAQLLDALFPMAAELSASVSKEFTVFQGRVHKDFLAKFLPILTDVLVAPRFDPKEFDRLKANALDDIRTGLREEDDEQLGKVALDSLLYPNHPYGHYVGGTMQGVQSITLDDVKAQAQRIFTQARLVIGLAGPVDDAVVAQVKSALAKLPATGAAIVQLPPAPDIHHRVLILQKPSISTAISAGYAYNLRRGDPDFFPIAFAVSYLGEHRQFNGVLMNELRVKRGLNYGDYAYAEHFVQSGYGTFAQTGIARSEQDFSLWLRPVEPQNAVFATRAGVRYLEDLVANGISQDQFALTQSFLEGYTRLWDQTPMRKLGYAIDGLFYGTPSYLDAYRAAIAKLTPAEVLAAVRRHLSADRLNFVYVTQDAAGLAKALANGAPSLIQYPSPKPDAVLSADKQIVGLPLPIDPAAIEVQSAQSFMER